MITWIQTSFAKHHKVTLGALLAVTIVSFVFFGAWSGAASGMRSASYLGVDLGDLQAREPYDDLAVLVGARGIEPLIFSKHLADVAQIPAPTDAQLAQLYQGGNVAMTPTIRRLFFVEQLKRNSRSAPASQEAVEARVDEAFRLLWRIEKSEKLLGGPEYTPPFEGVVQWRVGNTKWTIETATLAGAPFNPKVEVTDEKLKPWFAEHKADFTIKQQVAVGIAVFPATPADLKPLAGESPPSEDELRNFALNHSDVLKAGYPAFDVQKLDEHLKNNRADILRVWNSTKAPLDRLGERVTKWLDKRFKGNPPSYDSAKLAFVSEGAMIAEPTPFGEDGVPTSVKVGDAAVPAELLKNALRLSREDWCSSQYDMPLEPGKPARVVVFFHSKTIPAREPSFTEVREKIAAAYTVAEKSRLWDKHSSEVWQKLNAEIKAGKKVSDVAKVLGLASKNYPAFAFFSGGFPPELFPVMSALSQELLRTPERALTPKLRNGADTLFVYLAKREVSDPTTPEEKAQAQDFLLPNERRPSQTQWTLRSTVNELQNAIAPTRAPVEENVGEK
ncbi:MAG: hypothetical protein LBT53_05985 [Puniceicoccales bacterium]|jgi:hypothetical protein|nr:hypothetical protein [Puniceicoccales bacterium]